MKPIRVMLATGGTGGHVFPAIATAYELSKQDVEVFFATDIRGEKYLINKSFGYKIVNSASPSGGIVKKIKFAFKSFVGIIQALILLKKTKPQIVVGFGGYPSFPTIIAAKILGKKIILHEQNSVLGRSNAFLLKYARILATSFEKTKFATNGINTGNPVRQEIYTQPYPEFSGKINVLITGGSQGAKSFSKFFPEVFDGIENIFVTQQTKDEDIESVKNRYARMNIACELKPFFDDIDKKISEAHLVICRSGSSTIAEVTAIGRPAIFIPLPSSADNHQLLNAQAVADTKGAWVFEEKDFDTNSLNRLLREILGNYELLPKAAENIKKFAKPDAAMNLAKLIVDAIV